MLKPALIPIWIEEDGPAGLYKGAERPVLIEVEALGAALYGQMVKLTTFSIQVMPDEPILICPNVRVRASFRFADVEYTLSGLTVENDIAKGILFDFDFVTRRRMVTLASSLKDAGLMQDGGRPPKPDPEEQETTGQKVKPKPAKELLRRVRHEPPPGGIERRVHYRHELEAVVTLVVVNKGIVMRCLLLEISFSGCRVYSDVPIRILEDTHVEVDFIGQGYPFRMAARVRVKTDEHLLGLEFEKMNARTRDRLVDLLEELIGKCPPV